MYTRNLIMILTLLVCAYSCSKEKAEIETKSSSILNIGEEHNLGLDYVLKNLNSRSKKANKVNRLDKNDISSMEIAELSYEYAQSVRPNDITIIEKNKLIEEMATKLDIIREDLTITGIQNHWETTVTDAKKITSISATEQNAVSEIKQIFSDAYDKNFSNDNIYDFINERLEQIKQTNQNLLNNNNELFYGLMQIADSSNDYWKEYIQTNSPDPTTPVKPEPYLVQIDCLGYIVAWTKAVCEDNRKPGGVTPEGQWGRIETGLFGAIEFSSGGYISKKK